MQVRALLVVAWLGAWLGAPAEASTCRDAVTRACHAKLDGTRVVVCFEHGPRTCWALDLARPMWKRLPATALPASDACGTMQYLATPRSTIPSATVVTACAPDGSACHTVATPPASGLEVVTDGALVAVVEDDQITVADLNTGKVAATISPGPHPSNDRGWRFRDGVRFLGPDRLFAELFDGGATTLAWVFTAHSGAVALDLPGEFDNAPPVWLGDEFALAAAGSTELVFGDLKRSTRRSIPLFPGKARVALLAATPREIIAVQDGGDGTIAVVDGQATRLVPGPPVCR
jgi:hypothetical protein